MARPDPETLAREYRDGASLEALGARYGVAASTARSWLVRHGVAIRGRGGTQGPEPPAPELLVEAYQSGQTVRQVAATFHTHHQRVSAALREAGLEIRSTRHGPAADTLVRKYLAGATTKDLAKRYGSNAGTIASVLKDVGVELRGPAVRKPRRGPATDVLRTEYDAGFSTVALARKYGMSAHSVRMRLVRAGVVLVGRRPAPKPPH